MSQDIDAKAQAELVERLDSHMGQADMGEVLRDCRLARDVITTLTAERDFLAKNNEGLIASQLRMKDRYRKAAVSADDRATTAEALVQSMREALENIRELNFSGADENGNQWANSDLIDQEVIAALAQVKP